MQLSTITEHIEQGGSIVVEREPSSWCSRVGGMNGRREVKYPYTIEVVDYVKVKNSISPRVSVKDQNGYGWSLRKDYFEDGTLTLESGKYEEIEI